MRVTSAMIATAVAVAVAPGILADSAADLGLGAVNDLGGAQARQAQQQTPSDSVAGVQQPGVSQSEQQPQYESKQAYGGSGQAESQSGGQKKQAAQQAQPNQSPQTKQPQQQKKTNQAQKSQKAQSKQQGLMDKISTAAKLFQSPSTRPSRQRVTKEQKIAAGKSTSLVGKKGETAGQGSSKSSKNTSEDESSAQSSATDPSVNVMDAFSDLVHNYKSKDTLKQGVKDIFNSRAKEDDKKSDHYKQKYSMVKMKTSGKDKTEKEKREADPDEQLELLESRDFPMGAMPDIYARFASPEAFADPYPKAEAEADADPDAEAEADAWPDPEAEAYPSASEYAIDPLARALARRAILRRVSTLKNELERRKVDDDEEEDEDGDEKEDVKDTKTKTTKKSRPKKKKKGDDDEKDEDDDEKDEKPRKTAKKKDEQEKSDDDDEDTDGNKSSKSKAKSKAKSKGKAKKKTDNEDDEDSDKEPDEASKDVSENGKKKSKDDDDEGEESPRESQSHGLSFHMLMMI